VPRAALVTGRDVHWSILWAMATKTHHSTAGLSLPSEEQDRVRLL